MTDHSIVVADDDPHIRAMLVDILEEEGYSVTACGDGLCALNEVHRIQPKLVILDVAMPHLTGDAVLRQLRAEAFPGAVLIASADAQPKRFLNDGADRVLPKPFCLHALMDAVRSLLAGQRALNERARGA